MTSFDHGPAPGSTTSSRNSPTERARRQGEDNAWAPYCRLPRGRQDDAIPGRCAVPFYLNDRKRRISLARVGDRLQAFDDLCTCAGHAAAAWGGEADG